MRVQILDHGYLEVIETWGSDERIVESARMSTQRGFEGWGGACSECGGDGYDKKPRLGDGPCETCKGEGKTVGDEKLLAYLWKNKHSTPFEMAGLTIEVRAPIFVFREWHRHRTQSYSEASSRYAPLPALDYMPALDRLKVGGGHLTRQAQGTAPLAADDCLDRWLQSLAMWQETGETLYQEGLSLGVPKEIARLAMSVARYSTMRASTDLRNWLSFLTLRNHKHAQLEIRVYAEVLQEVLAGHFPRTLGLFAEGQGK